MTAKFDGTRGDLLLAVIYGNVIFWAIKSILMALFKSAFGGK